MLNWNIFLYNKIKYSISDIEEKYIVKINVSFFDQTKWGVNKGS